MSSSAPPAADRHDDQDVDHELEREARIHAEDLEGDRLEAAVLDQLHIG